MFKIAALRLDRRDVNSFLILKIYLECKLGNQIRDQLQIWQSTLELNLLLTAALVSEANATI